MSNVTYLTERVHARAPSSARASNVTALTSCSDANRERASQCPDGIPRSRQQLTVDGCTSSRAATAVVPPSASMTKSDVIMAPNIVCAVQTSQVFAFRKTTFSAKDVEIGGMIDPPDIIGKRLEALRVELGFKTQTAFAEALGIDKSTYSLYKTGDRQLTFETACLIRQNWGISLDWLFFGDLHQSAIQTMAKIGRGIEAPEQRAKKTGKK